MHGPRWSTGQGCSWLLVAALLGLLVRTYPTPAAETTMTPPPAEPVRWTAEFEPMHGTLIAWPLWSNDVQAAFCVMVDELLDVGVVYLLYDHEREKSGVIEQLTACGVAITNLAWVPYPNVPYSRIRDQSEGVFIRDYGPENIVGLHSGSWGIVDNRYFGFPKMNAVNATLTRTLHAAYFETPLTAEGGNLSPDGMGRVFATEWLLTENHGLGEAQTRQAFRDYYGAELVVLPRRRSRSTSTCMPNWSGRRPGWWGSGRGGRSQHAACGGRGPAPPRHARADRKPIHDLSDQATRPAAQRLLAHVHQRLPA